VRPDAFSLPERDSGASHQVHARGGRPDANERLQVEGTSSALTGDFSGLASNLASARETAAQANAAVTCVAAPRPPPQSSLSASPLAGRVPQTLPSACG